MSSFFSVKLKRKKFNPVFKLTEEAKKVAAENNVDSFQTIIVNIKPFELVKNNSHKCNSISDKVYVFYKKLIVPRIEDKHGYIMSQANCKLFTDYFNQQNNEFLEHKEKFRMEYDSVIQQIRDKLGRLSDYIDLPSYSDKFIDMEVNSQLLIPSKWIDSSYIDNDFMQEVVEDIKKKEQERNKDIVDNCKRALSDNLNNILKILNKKIDGERTRISSSILKCLEYSCNDLRALGIQGIPDKIEDTVKIFAVEDLRKDSEVAKKMIHNIKETKEFIDNDVIVNDNDELIDSEFSM